MAEIDAIKSGALKVQIKMETDHPALPLASQDTFGMVELVGPKFEEETRKTRAPIDLVTVIDISGSMAGDKIELVRNTLLFMVDQLKADDRLAIVLFESNVSRLTHLSALTDENKKKAKTAITSMRAGGGTNLSGGLLEGLQVLADRQTKNAVASCFLFTDGQPSTGIRDAPSLLRVAKAVTDKIDAVVSISTFGFGADHDANLLRGIADGANGMFYYVGSEEDISQAFADSLGGLLSVVAQNLDLVITAHPGCSIRELQVTYAYETVEAGRQYKFRLKDLYSEEKRDLVLRLHLDSATAETAAQPLLSATLSYFNVLLPGKESVSGEMVIRRAATVTLGDPNPSIEAQRNRIEVTRAIHTALEAGKRGDYAAGQKAIEAAQQRIKESKAAAAPVSANLLKDLDEAKADLSNRSAYAQGGAQKMMSKLSAHQQQRSNLASPMYSNACQVATKASFGQGVQQQQAMPTTHSQGYPQQQAMPMHPAMQMNAAPVHLNRVAPQQRNVAPQMQMRQQLPPQAYMNNAPPQAMYSAPPQMQAPQMAPQMQQMPQQMQAPQMPQQMAPNMYANNVDMFSNNVDMFDVQAVPNQLPQPMQPNVPQNANPPPAM